MKELSIEEKAKAYDIALDKIKRLLGTGSNCSREELEYVFPELKESEDERIKREIIELIMLPTWKTEAEFYRRKELRAWLEKQGENNIGISETTKKELEDNLNKALEKETPESWNEFLEKQGEQKPILDVEIPFGAKDSELQEASYYIPEGFHAEIESNRVVIKRGKQKPVEWHREDEQNLNACLGYIPDEFLRRWLTDIIHVKYDKPADKVEPKFKVGDKIKLAKEPNYPAREIIAIKNNAYYFDELVHLPFTEQDNWKLVEQKPNKCMYSEYNYTDEDRKVLCDGCEEDCELKKKPEWSEDERIRKEIICLIEGVYKGSITDYSKAERDRYVAYLEKQGEQKTVVIPKFRIGDIIRWKKADSVEYTIKEINDKGYINTANGIMDISQTDIEFELVEQKPDWSEEDEAVLDALIRRLKGEDVYVSPHLAAECLKSLKDRVQPQPKQEWSEEDETVLNNLIYALANDRIGNNRDEYVDWLKSLRPQKHWKPSDEQIEALDFAADCIVLAEFCVKRKVLKELLEQLKKLREE